MKKSYYSMKGKEITSPGDNLWYVIHDSCVEYNSMYQFVYVLHDLFRCELRSTLELLNMRYGFQDRLSNYNYRSADSFYSLKKPQKFNKYTLLRQIICHIISITKDKY
jgi:hypothetical protein